MKRLGLVLVVLTLAACGGGGSGASYGSAAAVAKAAGLSSCKADPQEVGVTEAMACGSTEVDWFKSHEALSASLPLFESSPDTFLVGSNWALECVRRPICVQAKAKLGGTLH